MVLFIKLSEHVYYIALLIFIYFRFQLYRVSILFLYKKL